MRKHMRLAALLTVAATALLAAPAATQRSIGYEFTPLDPDLPGAWGTTCCSINNRGEVVGNYLTGPPDSYSFHGFSYRSGLFTDVVVEGPGGPLGSALNGVNDSGVAVGNYWDDWGTYGFLYKDGRIEVLPQAFPGAGASVPAGINSAGTIVGVCSDTWGDVTSGRGFVLRHGRYTILDDPSGLGVGLYGINDRGQMLGYWGPWLFFSQCFLQDGPRQTLINVPGATMTTAWSLNNKGQIAGFYFDQGWVSHGFVYGRGTYTTIDYPGATDTAVLGINDHGAIVGTYNGWSFGFMATPKR